jgi:hypothetical protein
MQNEQDKYTANKHTECRYCFNPLETSATQSMGICVFCLANPPSFLQSVTLPRPRYGNRKKDKGPETW